jgi:hypothetical protein
LKSTANIMTKLTSTATAWPPRHRKRPHEKITMRNAEADCGIANIYFNQTPYLPSLFPAQS